MEGRKGAKPYCNKMELHMIPTVINAIHYKSPNYAPILLYINIVYCRNNRTSMTISAKGNSINNKFILLLNNKLVIGLPTVLQSYYQLMDQYWKNKSKAILMNKPKITNKHYKRGVYGLFLYCV
jgi:hypothetical protein